jgi:hypothetical protein
MYIVLVMLMLYSSLSFNVDFGMNLYLSNQVLIKLDQLKLFITVNQSAFPCFWPSCHIIRTISVPTLVIIAAQNKRLM